MSPYPVAGTFSLAYERVREQMGYIERRVRDGEPVVYLWCPKCKARGEIGDDQLHGRVSVICVGDGCDFHETRDWYRSALTTPWDWGVSQ